MARRWSSWIIQIYYWLTERLYNELAWAYDLVSWIVSLGQWDSVRKLALEYIVGRRVLEFGFGTGELLIEMQRKSFQVVGLERTLAMQKQTGDKIHRQGMQISRVRAVTQHAPFADQSFDTIVSTYPAGYILDPQTWHEAYRLIGSNNNSCVGRFVVVGATVAFSIANKSKLSENVQGGVFSEVIATCGKLATKAGLNFRVDVVRHRLFVVPIIIAERPS